MSQPSVIFFRPDAQSFCIDVPLTAEGCADISCSTMIKTFAPKREAKVPSSSSAGSTTAEATTGQLPFKTKGRTNPYDNIIERLERKYASQVFFEEDNNASGDDDNDEEDDAESTSDKEASKGENVGSSSSNGENGTSSTTTTGGPAQIIKKNKKKRHHGLEEYYDMDDGFVDDSEELALANVDLKRKKLKTKHGGFFVSSGELEVFRMDSSPGSDTTVAAGQGQLHSKSNVAAAGDGKKVKKSGAAGAQTGTSSSNGNGSKGEGVVRVKTPWVPKTTVAVALNQLQSDYKQDVSNCNDSSSSTSEEVTNSSKLSRIGKNGVLPPDTEARVFAVHQLVRKEYGKAFPPGYLDQLVDVLGGSENPAITTGRLKNLLTRLDYRESAAQLKAEKEALTEELEQMIPGKVVPFVVTAQLLAVKGKKKQQQTSNAVAAPALAASPTDGANVDETVTAIVVATGSSSSSSSSSSSGAAPTEGSTTAPGGGGGGGGVGESPAATAAAVNEIDPLLASFKWQVRWDASMKAKLLKLDQVLGYSTLYALT